MRDLILCAALIGIVPLILRAPIFGLLAWVWITLMHPQREVFGFLAGFQLNLAVAAATALAWALSSERKLVPMNLFTGLLGVFFLWTCLSTYYALDRKFSYPLWDGFMKTVILLLAVMTLANTRTRIQAVVWIVVVSLGFHAVKGGGFVLATAGQQRVFGPENSMIYDNNSLGLAMVALLPLINFLRATSERAAVRAGLLGLSILTLVAIIGTYSRGALLALVIGVAVYVLRSRSGLVVLGLAVILSLALPSIAPSSWLERMSTLQSVEQDASFEGRRAAWRTAVNIASARPLTGGGFSATNLDPVVAAFQSPGSLTTGKAAHSIYFQVLGDTGFVGLGLYLLMVAAAVLNTFRVLAATKDRPELAWANLLARMLQVSMATVLVGGAALSMAYYDGFLLLFALTTALLLVVRQPVGALARTAAGPSWKQLGEALPEGPKRTPGLSFDRDGTSPGS